MGLLEGWQVGVKVSPNRTISLPTIVVDKRPPVPADSFKRVNPPLSVPTLQLARFAIPRADFKEGNGQIATDRRADHSDRIQVSIVDPNGRRITGAFYVRSVPKREAIQNRQ